MTLVAWPRGAHRTKRVSAHIRFWWQEGLGVAHMDGWLCAQRKRQVGGLQSRFTKMMMVRRQGMRSPCIEGFKQAVGAHSFCSCWELAITLQLPGSPCHSCQVHPLSLLCGQGYQMMRSWHAWIRSHKLFLTCTTGAASPTPEVWKHLVGPFPLLCLFD